MIVNKDKFEAKKEKYIKPVYINDKTYSINGASRENRIYNIAFNYEITEIN